jgi:hypothetical protein
VCVRCGGEFVMGLVGAQGQASFGWVELHPGSWGRYKGLPVLASAMDTMEKLGVTTIRQGGTVSQGLRWKDWRGEPAYRASSIQTWQSSLIGGWGPFEIIDLANAAGIEPIVTLADDTNNAADYADLVEYCWGNEDTYWGNLRITQDGHPQPYNLTVVELGNEQVRHATAAPDGSSSWQILQGKNGFSEGLGCDGSSGFPEPGIVTMHSVDMLVA